MKLFDSCKILFLNLFLLFYFSIEIHFNINNTVDNEVEANVDPAMDKAEFGELKSKPSFDVDIKRGNTTLSFACSIFSEPSQNEEGYSKFFTDYNVLLQVIWHFS